MSLTDAVIRRATLGDKPSKLYDAHGLYLLVNPTGSKLWRFKYRFAGVEKGISLGPYPLVSLDAARKRRDEARLSVLNGVDPSAERRARKQLAQTSPTASEFSEPLADRFADGPRTAAEHSATKHPAIERQGVKFMGSPIVHPKIRRVLARNLKHLLAQAEMSENALSQKIKLSQKQINNITNSRTGAGIDSLQEMAEALGVEAWQLLHDGTDPEGLATGKPSPSDTLTRGAVEMAIETSRLLQDFQTALSATVRAGLKLHASRTDKLGHPATSSPKRSRGSPADQ